jgi:sRNA-binding protein
MIPDRTDTIATIALLVETYPKTFTIIESKRRPLKIGIYSDLAAALDGAITEDEIKRTMRHYTSSEGYLKNLLCGAWRFDLDGKVVGVVTRTEEDHAKRRLAGLEAAQARRKTKAERQQADALERTQPRRLSLADLREAGRRRAA